MNRFRDKTKRKAYDQYVAHFVAGTYLFADGLEYRGSSDRHAFWAGYHGWWSVRVDAEFKRSISYPAYRAGQDCAKLNQEGK